MFFGILGVCVGGGRDGCLKIKVYTYEGFYIQKSDVSSSSRVM